MSRISNLTPKKSWELIVKNDSSNGPDMIIWFIIWYNNKISRPWFGRVIFHDYASNSFFGVKFEIRPIIAKVWQNRRTFFYQIEKPYEDISNERSVKCSCIFNNLIKLSQDFIHLVHLNRNSSIVVGIKGFKVIWIISEILLLFLIRNQYKNDKWLC